MFSNLYLTKINWILETLALDNFYIKRAPQWYLIKYFKNDFKFYVFQSIVLSTTKAYRTLSNREGKYILRSNNLLRDRGFQRKKQF